MNKITLKNFTISNQDPFALVAGPCQIESESHVLMMAENFSLCVFLRIYILVNMLQINVPRYFQRA